MAYQFATCLEIYNDLAKRLSNYLLLKCNCVGNFLLHTSIIWVNRADIVQRDRFNQQY